MNRSMLVSLVIVSAAALIGCATTSDPNSLAEAQCTYLARAEGLTLRQIEGVQSNANGTIALNLRVEDAVGRHINAVCNYATASNRAAWAQPLPAGLRRG